MTIHYQPLEKRRSLASAWRGVAHWFGCRLRRSDSYTATIDRAGLRFTVPRDTIFSWHLAKYRAYEAPLTNWIARRVQDAPQGLYVDVGANFGWYTCVMAGLCEPGGRVVAFEPADENLRRLRANIAANQLEDRVRVVAQGAAREPGTAVLHRAPDANPGMHSFVAMPHLDGGGAGVALPLTTLDVELAGDDRPVELIKLDIEGYEFDALLGARDTLRRTRAVVLEYSPAFLRKAGHDPLDLARLLQNAGFRLHELRHDALVPLDLAQITARLAGETWDFFQFDLVALHSGAR